MELDSRALDAHIEGLHDPRHPANQADWTEGYCNPILNECDWITDKMLEDDQIHQELGEIIESVTEHLYMPDECYSKKQREEKIKTRAKDLAANAKVIWDIRQRHRMILEGLGYRGERK